MKERKLYVRDLSSNDRLSVISISIQEVEAMEDFPIQIDKCVTDEQSCSDECY